ncbi:FecR domain-containing protein, partial [Candidatus Dependentiae bacterium]|nr:FecR domain-containing protein [Candidatus Dependentiae bacterium]
MKILNRQLNLKKNISLLFFFIYIVFSSSIIAAEKIEYMNYIAKKGDTLYSLAEKYLGNFQKWKELAKLNKIKNPNAVPLGTVIKIPVTDEKVYTLESVSGDVLFRRNPMDAWNKATEKDSFPEGVEFKTQNKSRALVKTKDEDIIILRDNTEINFQRPDVSKKSAKSLKLSSGVLDIKVMKKLNNKTKEATFEVKTPIGVVGVRGTKFIFDYDTETQKNKLSVNEGLVKNSASGKTVEVAEGFGSITEKGSTPSAPIALPRQPELLFPKAGYLTNKNEINLEWSKISEAYTYKIELAYDTFFTKLEASAFIPKGGSHLTKETVKTNEIPDGKFYWRVTALDANGLEGQPSAFESFNISRTIPILDINSPDNFGITEEAIIISGVTNPYNEVFINSSKILADESGKFAASMIFKPGIALLHIKSRDKAGNIIHKQMYMLIKGEGIEVEKNIIYSHSKTMHIQGEVEQGTNICFGNICMPVSGDGKISSFIPVSPEPKPFTLTIYESGADSGKKIFENYSIMIPSVGTPELIAPADKLITNKNIIELKWNKIQHSNSFKVEIASEPEFKNILVSGNINSRSSQITVEVADIALPEKDGVYFWRVTALDENNIEGTPSDYRQIILKTQKPEITLSAPENMSVTENGVVFKGKTGALNKVYINGAKVSADNDGNFSAMLGFEPGFQFIKIKSIDETGNEMEKQIILLVKGAGIEIEKNAIKCSLPYLKITGEINPENTIFYGSQIIP